MENDIKTNKAGIPMEISAEFARVLHRFLWKSKNPEGTEESWNATWDIEVKECRTSVRSALNSLKKRGIELQKVD